MRSPDEQNGRRIRTAVDLSSYGGGELRPPAKKIKGDDLK
jgi:hypothetical protein